MPEIGAIDILKKTEQKFQANMATFILNTSAIYNRFFALMNASTKTEPKPFFKSKIWGLRLDMALLQTEMTTLASGALNLAGIDASLDGYSDMISLEKKIDSSKCLVFETNSHRKVVFQPLVKKGSGRTTLGEELIIFCAGDFILIGTHKETASGNGGVFHLRYAPVPLKCIISRQFDVYGSLDNVIEMNLCNSVLIAVQTDGAANRQLLAAFLNSAKQSNKMLITPKFWLVDKPAAEAGAVLYTEPVMHPIKIQMTKPLDTADTVTELCSMPLAEMKRISHSAPMMTDKKAVWR
ncbi:hypothetical protein HDU80_000155, partial [Chytriomyces hyalinus]